jgi:two-component system CheB/CheR fusion protein
MSEFIADQSACSKPRAIVAIGASAGGLNPIRDFLQQIPAQSQLAFVVMQHLDPTRESSMRELTRKWTLLPVVTATNNMMLKPNEVYLIPSGFLATIEHDQLRLVTIDKLKRHKSPISELFSSLALSAGSRAVGVVLSGAGRDGSEGLLSIKKQGGLILAQNPATAKFSSMPEAAITVGHAKTLLPPQEMVAWIIAQLDKRANVTVPETETEMDESEKFIMNQNNTMMQLLELLGKRSGNDFSGYKPTTVGRRIDRRIGIRNVSNLAEYLALVKEDEQELDRLAEDMLIGVTSFYRDPEAFDELSKEVVPVLFKKETEKEPVRVWVAGCATGEEAYTLACILYEFRRHNNLSNPIQIFASDIDAAALEYARTGVYQEESLNKLPAALRDACFQKQEHVYKISKEVRESIVFAVHNLISDPPFSRMDLVVCRNVLIYMDQQVQQYLMRLFAAVLNPGGYLFLGCSETIGTQQSPFVTLSKQWRIFRKENDQNEHVLPGVMSRGATNYRSLMNDLRAPMVNDPRVTEKNFQQLVERFGAVTLLLSPKAEILFSSGQVSKFLELRSGEPNFDLFALLVPSLRTNVRTLFNKVLTERTVLVTTAIIAEKNLQIRITVKPVLRAPDDYLILLTLDEDAVQPNVESIASAGESWIVVQLEQELMATREDLQRTIEKLSMSNEDLKSVNEEFMATNEELQSANEELESSKEELQSLNEELQTTNVILDAKVQELELVNADLSNLFSSTDLATLFLDTEFHLKRFTPASRRILSLIDSDLGRPVSDIASELVDHDLLEGADEVLRTQEAMEFEVQDKKGRSYLKRILPYRINASSFDGIVMTFSDVTALKKAKDRAQELAGKLQKQAQLLDLPLVFARDMDDRIIFWNRGAEEFYGYSVAEAMGQVSHELLHTGFPVSEESIIRQLNDAGKWHGELVHTTKNGQLVSVNSQWVVAKNANKESWAIVEVNTDISEQKTYQTELDYLLHHDPLTQLPNQIYLKEKVDHALLTAKLSRTKVALLFLDLDRFKTINDSLGHGVGNTLLVAVAKRISAVIDEFCDVSRFGGDEFAVMIENIQDPNRASHIAYEVLDSLRAPFLIEGCELFVGASIGISLFPVDASDTEGLFRCADAALNLAKEEGRGQVKFFMPELNQRAHRSLAIEMHLRKALTNNELSLVYQPQVHIDTGRIKGAEALLRWQNEELGSVSPAEFIPVAEESGIIVELGEWVFREVVALLERWQCEQFPGVRLSLNISPVQFRQPVFLKLVTELMQKATFPPQLLELELTERIFLGAPEVAIEFFENLRRLGLRLSFDDFGTGFCSLQYLRQLRLSHIKVAREFIPKDDNDVDNIVISRSIVSLAKGLEIESTVEGIETEKQLAFFSKTGCQFVQGFLFSKPVSLIELEKLILTNMPLKQQDF